MAGTLKPHSVLRISVICSRGDARLAAHENHAELVVPDPVFVEGLVHGHRERPFAVEKFGEVRGERSPCPLAADRIYGAPTCRGEQPGRRILGNAARGPVLHRRDEGLLDDIFGELQIVRAQEAREHRDQPAGLAPEDVSTVSGERSDIRVYGAATPLIQIIGRLAGHCTAVNRATMAGWNDFRYGVGAGGWGRRREKSGSR